VKIAGLYTYEYNFFILIKFSVFQRTKNKFDINTVRERNSFRAVLRSHSENRPLALILSISRTLLGVQVAHYRRRTDGFILEFKAAMW
jgi:hypothetical protein